MAVESNWISTILSSKMRVKLNNQIIEDNICHVYKVRGEFLFSCFYKTVKKNFCTAAQSRCVRLNRIISQVWAYKHWAELPKFPFGVQQDFGNKKFFGGKNGTKILTEVNFIEVQNLSYSFDEKEIKKTSARNLNAAKFIVSPAKTARANPLC